MTNESIPHSQVLTEAENSQNPTTEKPNPKDQAQKRTFHIHTSPTTTLSLQIHEPHLKSSHLGLSTWAASLVLADLLHKLQLPQSLTTACSKGSSTSDCGTGREPEAKSVEVLELGAGTALAGLSAACVCSNLAVSARGRAVSVTLTDLPDVVPNLAANASLNAEILRKHGAAVQVGVLDWTHPSTLTLTHTPAPSTRDSEHVKSKHGGSYDVVLAADTIYSPEHPSLLAATIKYWLKRTKGARVVLAYPMRVAYLDDIRAFWGAMEAKVDDGEGQGREVAESGSVEDAEEVEVEGSGEGVDRRRGLRCLREGREEVDAATWDDEGVIEWCVWAWDDLMN